MAIKVLVQRSPDAYDTVLADLRQQRDEIDKAIALLTRLRVDAPQSSYEIKVGQSEREPIPPHTFTGLSIVDAAKKLIKMRGHALGNREITEDIVEGGVKLNSADPINTVSAVLTRYYKESTDLNKVGRGVWGLNSPVGVVTKPPIEQNVLEMEEDLVR